MKAQEKYKNVSCVVGSDIIIYITCKFYMHTKIFRSVGQQNPKKL